MAAKGNRLAMRPPRSKNPETRNQNKDWNEGFAAINQEIPTYCVAEDKFA